MVRLPVLRKNVRPALTRRQQDVCSLLSQGKTNKEIAHLLRLSEGTVRIYVGQMLERTGAKNRVQLAVRWKFDRRNLVGNFTA